MENKKRVFTVLCIDGGGIRGVIPARILQEIEERTGKPIAELFDLVGGASTGAIVASGLISPDDNDPTKPRCSAKQMKDFYFQHGGKVFPEMRFKMIRKLSTNTLYDPKPLEDALQLALGDTRIKDSLTSVMIPATDIKNFRPVWISHSKGQKDNSPEGWSTMKLRDAVRGATTVPTYFPTKYYTTTPNEDMPNITHRHALIDGGFFAGNMLRRLLTQARRLAPPDAEIVVVHVGTGMVDHSLSPEEFNRLGPIGLVTKENGSLLMHLIVNMSAHEVQDDVRSEIGDRYIGFDGNIDPEVDPNDPSTSMDDASLKNLKALEQFAEKMMIENSDQMDRLCSILKNRSFAEQQHEASRTALQQLTDRLEEPKTVKALATLYRKILNFASGIEEDDKPEPGDDTLKELAQRLSPQHKSELDRIYHVMQDRLESQSQILNQLKQTGDDVTKIIRKISGPFSDSAKDAPKDEETPKKPDNDNKPPAAQPQKPPRRRWWG